MVFEHARNETTVKPMVFEHARNETTVKPLVFEHARNEHIAKPMVFEHAKRKTKEKKNNEELNSFLTKKLVQLSGSGGVPGVELTL